MFKTLSRYEHQCLCWKDLEGSMNTLPTAALTMWQSADFWGACTHARSVACLCNSLHLAISSSLFVCTSFTPSTPQFPLSLAFWSICCPSPQPTSISFLSSTPQSEKVRKSGWASYPPYMGVTTHPGGQEIFSLHLLFLFIVNSIPITSIRP